MIKKDGLKNALLMALILGTVGIGSGSYALDIDNGDIQTIDSTVSESVNIINGQLTNNSTISGTLHNYAQGTLINTNSGTISEAITNEGSFTNNGAISAAITNSGNFTNNTDLTQNITNSGNGSILGNGALGSLINTDNAVVNITAGVKDITNTSSKGISVKAVTNDAINNGTGTITVSNDIGGNAKTTAGGNISIGGNVQKAETTNGQISVTGNVTQGIAASGTGTVTAASVTNGGINTSNTASVIVTGAVIGDVVNDSTSSNALKVGDITGNLTSHAGTVEAGKISGNLESSNGSVKTTDISGSATISGGNANVGTVGNGILATNTGSITSTGVTNGGAKNSGSGTVNVNGTVIGDVESSLGAINITSNVTGKISNTAASNAQIYIGGNVSEAVENNSNNANGTIKVNGTANSVKSTGAANTTTGAVTTTVENSGSGKVTVTSVGTDVTNSGAGGVEVATDVSGKVTNTSAAASQIKVNGNVGGAVENNSNSNNADIIVNGTANSVKNAGASKITTGAVTTTVENSGSGNVTVLSAGTDVTNSGTGGINITRNVGGNVTNELGSGSIINIGGNVAGTVANKASGTNANIVVKGTANAVNNSGASQITTGAVTTDVTNSSTGKVTVASAGGNVSNSNAGEIKVNGAVGGNVSNSGSGIITTGAVAGNANNTSTGTVTVGKVDGNVTNSSTGTLTTNGVVAGNVTNSGGGEYINKGSVSGDINNSNDSIVTNNNTVSGTVNNSGTFNNNSKLTGVVNNTGAGVLNTSVEGLTSASSVTNNATINFNGVGGATQVNIGGSGTVDVNTNLVLNNDIGSNTLKLSSGVLSFGSVNTVNKFNGVGGTVNIADGTLNEGANLGDITLDGKTNLAIDFDVTTETTDTLGFNSITNNGGSFNISGVSVQGMTTKEFLQVDLGQTTNIGRENITSNTFELPWLLTPIKRLRGTVSNGYLTYDGRPREYKYFNPCVVASAVATQIGGFLNQSQMLQDGFYHSDRYFNFAAKDRFSAEHTNIYASSNGITTFNSSNIPETSQGMWVKPYATFEQVDLRGGTGVSNVNWGMMIGGDSQLREYSNGWKGVISAFVSYNGNHIAYDGVSLDQQGGWLGLTHTWYKGNFFTGVTLSGGASAGSASTMYGTDHYWMATGGVGSKTGYNWEIKDGLLIVQPSLFVGYTFVNTFDYMNSAGVRISTDPVNAIQVIPGIKFISNLPHGWQPYMGLDVVVNIIDKTHFMANDIIMPTLSVKPYIQYGFGVQKTWKERFTAFIQAMFRGGGREGVALSFGFRWALGKGSK